MDYYVFATEVAADACVTYINVTKGWYPIVGECAGCPAPENQQTERWVNGPREMLSGEWAVSEIPDERFDYMKVPVTAEDKAELLATYGQDIRTLTEEDFVVEE